MRTSIVALALALGLSGCDKQDKDAPKDQPVAEAKPAEDKAVEAKPAEAKPVEARPVEVAPTTPPPEPPPAADPTASWTEHKGAGFVLKGPRAPTEESATAPTPAGPQPVTMYVGYEPAGFQGSFQTAVSDMTAMIKAAGTQPDPKKTLDDSVTGWIANIPSATIEKDEPIAGVDAGRSVRARGNHPQGGPFSVYGHVYFHDNKVFMVQALYVDAKDEALATAFVDSFKLVD